LFQEVNESWDAEEEIVESWEDIEVYIIFHLQGYPQRMRLQRRFYGKYSVYFLMFRILCKELDSFVAMTTNRQLEDKIQGRRCNLTL